MTRIGLGAILVTVFVTTGCGKWAGQWENWGNQKREPEVQAASASTQSFVYQYVPLTSGEAFAGLPGQVIQAGGRQWVAARGTSAIPDAMMKPVVTNAAGVVITALSWDNAPYDRLYVKTAPGQYTVLE